MRRLTARYSGNLALVGHGASVRAGQAACWNPSFCVAMVSAAPAKRGAPAALPRELPHACIVRIHSDARDWRFTGIEEPAQRTG